MHNLTLSHLGRGIAAGFVATVVLSVLMLMKNAMGLMPDLDVIKMLSQMMGNSGPAMAWLAHFVIGSVIWGSLFAWLSPLLPGPQWLRGVVFATGAWLMMMIAIMPMAGAGAFGLSLGIISPIATLMLHWVYGAVLGGTYGSLVDANAKVALSR